MENKNTILALLLMLLVWTGFTVLFPPQQEEKNSVSQSAEEQIVNKSHAVDSVNNTSVSTSSSSDNGDAIIKGDLKTLDTDELVTFDNDIFALKFNKRGATISSINLLEYHQENTSDSEPVALLDEDKRISTLNVLSGSGFGLSGDEIYTVERRVTDAEQQIIFSATLETGIVVDKVFTFHPESYLVGVDINITNNSDEILSDVLQIHLNNYWDENYAENRFDYIGFTSYVADELHEDEIEDISSAEKTYTGNVSWSGFTNKYFLSALVNKDNVFDAVRLERDAQRITNTALISDLRITPNTNSAISFNVYLGPKDIDYLSSGGKNLTEVVDFGFFAFLSKPLHLCLNFFYDYVHNYGVAIIILTVIIKLLFWPLTQKSYTSMKAMQTLQPEMKKLREKYRGDKEGLNRSMMELYKEHRVNPLGGCLPMIVQIPVFIALYKVLLGTIELRHAPFALWITDLSVKDPYYITPIIMGATMFIQQKMTPSTMDPLQAKMMLAMPVVFTFIFLNFPSGLVLYWLVNNLLTIFQQYLIYRKPTPVKA